MKELFSCLEIDAILVGGGRTKFIQNQQQPFEGRGKKRQSLKKKKRVPCTVFMLSGSMLMVLLSITKSTHVLQHVFKTSFLKILQSS